MTTSNHEKEIRSKVRHYIIHHLREIDTLDTRKGEAVSMIERLGLEAVDADIVASELRNLASKLETGQ